VTCGAVGERRFLNAAALASGEGAAVGEAVTVGVLEG